MKGRKLKMDKKIKIAVYGSLRVGHYNYKHFLEVFGAENFHYVKTVIGVEGFLLYSLGAYPAILENDLSNPLVVDIMECSEEVHSVIKMMELGAGYNEKIIDIDGDDCIIYVYSDTSISTTNHLVENGDWSHHLRVRQFHADPNIN